MNTKFFKVIFSKHLAAYIPVAETAPGQRKSARSMGAAQLAACLLVALAPPAVADFPVPCAGGACGTSPAASTPFVGSGGAGYSQSGNSATVSQTTPRAILNWQNYNLGAGKTLTYQYVDGAGKAPEGARFATLNRIWQLDPSQIAGKLQTLPGQNGQITLINQNGILFKGGAQINVSSLVASTLNMPDALFLNPGGHLTNALDEADFRFEGDAASFASSLIRIEPGAEISTQAQGYAFFFAPTIYNAGTVSTPSGQTVMAAGGKVYLTVLDLPKEPDKRADLDKSLPASLRGLAGVLVEVDGFNGTDASGNPATLSGKVVNEALGRIFAERGNITLAALMVNQSGRLTATTSVNNKGSIRLQAGENRVDEPVIPNNSTRVNLSGRKGELVLGEGSLTEVLPDMSDTQASLDEQIFNPSTLDFIGKTVSFKANSRVRAPGAMVTINAQAADVFQVPGAVANDSLVDFAAGSVIDLAGAGAQAFAYWNDYLLASGRAGEQLSRTQIEVDMARNFIPIELRGNELRDAPLLREGPLRGKTVWIDTRKGTPLIDAEVLQTYLSKTGRTVAERLATGGSLSVKSEGDILFRDGAKVDVSGGSIRYLDGFGQTSKLILNGKPIDIGQATPDRIYSGLADSYTVSSKKWGVNQTYTSPKTFYSGYTQGKDAGQVSFDGHRMVVNGELLGKVTLGDQRNKNQIPQGGRLVLGSTGEVLGGKTDFRLQQDVLFSAVKTVLSGDLSTNPQSWQDTLLLSPDFIQQGGFNRVAVYSNGHITVPKEAPLHLAAGGEVKLTGHDVRVMGDIVSPGGTIELATKWIIGTPDYAGSAIKVDGRLDVAGGWVNDRKGSTDAGLGPIFIDAGNVSIQSLTGIDLTAGSVVNASGGAWRQANGAFKYGKGGAIKLGSNVGQNPSLSALTNQGQMRLDGSLWAYAAQQGGSLQLRAAGVTIGGTGPASPADLWLDSGFFRRGGFSDYTLTGATEVRIKAGSLIEPAQENLEFRPTALTAVTGSNPLDLANRVMLPVDLRQPTHLSLSALNVIPGTADVGLETAVPLVMEGGSAIHADPQSKIKLAASGSLFVGGNISAPAGAITLSIEGLDIDRKDFDPSQSIWLAAGAGLSANGYYRPDAQASTLRTGEMLGAGKIVVNAERGYVVAEAGSLMEVSGSAATLDIPLAGGLGYRATQVAGDAGSITVASREGMFLDGEMRGGAQAGAQGGSFSLTLDAKNFYRSNIPFYPSGDRVIVLTPGGAALPAGMKFGAAFDTASHNGKAYLAVDKLELGGFAQFSARSEDIIALAAGVDLTLPRGIALDAPVLAAEGTGAAKLEAAYVYLGNSNINPAYQTRTATPGDSALTVNADWIDLEGEVALQGYKQTHLNADGDIRLRSVVLPAVMSGVAKPVTFVGGLHAAGELKLTAAQIYPSTLTRYTLEAGDKLTIASNNNAPAPVLSAGGELILKAREIWQQGVLKAPFGRIVVDAGTDVVHFTDNSLTSVSGEGQVVPFGRTANSGRDYFYPAVGLDVASEFNKIAFLPDTEVEVKAAHVDMAAGAKVDLSGGGDLLAWEFLKGPGGSHDVLDAATNPNTWAVIPALGQAYAPHDVDIYKGGANGLAAGDRVTLAEGSGLPAGSYTLLPARYALLPGAWLVSAVSKYQDLAPGQSVGLANGSRIVAGYLAHLERGNVSVGNGRYSGFLVRPGADATKQSEYLNSYASAYFDPALNRMPEDAKRLSISAMASLKFDASLITSHPLLTRGAELDIAAPKIAVTSPGGAAVPSDFIQLDADRLNGLNVASLLLGGTRARKDGTTVLTVASHDLLLANDSKHALTAPEIILAAQDTVRLAAGSAIEAKPGTETGEAEVRVRDPEGSSDNNGALLRVGNKDSRIIRDAPVTKGTTGSLLIESDATGNKARVAGKAITLDATAETIVKGDIIVAEQGSLSLAAGGVSLGAVPSGVSGLVFGQGALTNLSTLTTLNLRSYGNIDIYGDAVNLGASNMTLTLDAAGIAGHSSSSGAATISAGKLMLTNSSGASYTAPTASAGKLAVNVQTLNLGPGEFAIGGYDNVTVAAAQEIIGSGRGELKIKGGDLHLTAARLTTESGANTKIQGDGLMRFDRAAAGLVLPDAQGVGGSLKISAKRVELASVIDMTAGSVHIDASGSGNALVLEDGAAIRAPGKTVAFSDTNALLWAGKVTLSADNGNIDMASGAEIDVSAVPGGDAGKLAVHAGGTAKLKGRLKGYALPDSEGRRGRGGQFELKVGSLDDFSALNAKLEYNAAAKTGGFDGSRDLRVRKGDLTIAATDTVTAHDIRIAVDDGNLTVAGELNAGGIAQSGEGKGGTIELYARQGKSGEATGNVTLKSTGKINLAATTAAAYDSGTGGEGGNLYVSTATAEGENASAGAAHINFEAGSSISLAGAGKSRNGRMYVRAPRTASGIAVAALASTISAADRIVVEGYRVFAGVDTVTTGSSSMGTTLGFNTVRDDMKNYLSTQGAAIKTALGAVASRPEFMLTPGVEIRSAADLTIAADWNWSAYRYNASSGALITGPALQNDASLVHGMLTLRAPGNLNLNGSLLEGVLGTSTSIYEPSHGASYRLVAGSDLAAADPRALKVDAVGNLSLAAGKVVRSNTGEIALSAAGNLDLQGAVYTLGRSKTYQADSGDASFTSLARAQLFGMLNPFTQGGGDVSVRVAGNIIGSMQEEVLGGVAAAPYWLFRQGMLQPDGTMSGLASDAPAWMVAFNRFGKGLGTFGGGDVAVSAGGSVQDLTVAVATNARLGRDASNPMPNARALDVSGGGNLRVESGGDIAGGLYYVAMGQGLLKADGAVTASSSYFQAGSGLPIHPILHLGDAQVRVQARGAAAVGEVSNPTTMSANSVNGSLVPNIYSYSVNPDKPATASLSISSATSDAVLHGFERGSNADVVAPSSLRMEATGGNVVIEKQLQLYPAPSGNLVLLAQQDVNIKADILMSDQAPASLANIANITGPTALLSTGASAHDPLLLHRDDDDPVLIEAQFGNIKNSGAGAAVSYLPKFAKIRAGRDILDFNFRLQNLRPADVSLVEAGRDFTFTTTSGPNDAGLQVGGPGYLVVMSGNDTDLGNSAGIVSRGNQDNPHLPEGGASLTVMAGVQKANDKGGPNYAGFSSTYLTANAQALQEYQAGLLTDAERSLRYSLKRKQPTLGAAELDQQMASPENVEKVRAAYQASLDHFATLDVEARSRLVFFNELKLSGRAAADPGGASYKNYERGQTAIATLFPIKDGAGNPTNYSGDINLFFSQIKSEQNGDIQMFAPGGLVNAGLASASTSGKTGDQLGIVTVAGGNISAYVRDDFLVNQSRVFVLGEGNILLWAGLGDIDAGRGAKSTSSTPPPQIRIRDGQIYLDITGSVTGSGIGVLQTNLEVRPGDVDLIAPNGEVNAGDAGIRSAGNLTIAAVRVVGADNIKVGGTSTGVPVADTGGLAGSLSGLSSLTDTAAGDPTKSLGASARDAEKNARQALSSLKPSLVSVEVVGFGDCTTEEERDTEECRKAAKKAKEER